jgi:hypothetical protein
MPLPEPAMRELEAMDAAVRGYAVDPEFAEVAELAVLLSDSRPQLTEARASELDRRFAGLRAPRVTPRPRRRPAWILRPAYGAGLALAAALVVAVVVLAGRGGGSSGSHSGAFAAAGSAAGVSLAAPTEKKSASPTTHGASSSSSSSSSVSRQQALSPAPGPLPTPAPVPNGRRIIQSAQLSLIAPGARISTVAQELFDVVGAERGIVEHSQVASGAGASASFTLSIPAANLSVTLTRLAQLRYARVSSSSASTADVNRQYLDDGRALADAKALRSSLLTQLESASTTASIDSLKAQIHDAESTIAADERTVDSLDARISYSSLSVEIEAGATPVVPSSGGGGFTISRAAHDALRVLTAVGGGALIALAVLVPLGLLAAVAVWIGFGWRRRRRERLLDGA